MTATAIKWHPILFNGVNIRRLLNGCKTQTRRVVTKRNSQIATGEKWADLLLETARARSSPGGSVKVLEMQTRYAPTPEDGCARVYPIWQPGDRLWVRETVAIWRDHAADVWLDDEGRQISPVYAASSREWDQIRRDARDGHPWKITPSILMKRQFSRITLEIVGVRVERLQLISEEDAKAEGVTIPEDVTMPGPYVYRNHFQTSWDQTNAGRSGCLWADNPWVWAIEFRRVLP